MRLTTKLIPVLLLAACQTMPPATLHSSLRVWPELDELKPADIAILPVEDATPSKVVTPHLDAMRAHLAAALIERHYSPLSQNLIDLRLRETGAQIGSSPVDAAHQRSVAGRFGEDALLGVTLLNWDESALMNNATVTFTARVSMLHSATEKVLWSGTIDGIVRSGGDGVAPQRRADRASSAVQVFADALIGELPQRRL